MADDVTRYAMVTDITPLKNGEWVRYEDYAALAAELERVKGELTTARADAQREARERVLQLDRYGHAAPDVVLSRVVLGDVLTAIGGGE